MLSLAQYAVMLRFVTLLWFALGAALASPASALVAQYLDVVTTYHVEADSINSASFKAQLETILKQRCGNDGACPTTKIYDDLKALTRALPDQSSGFLSPQDLAQVNPLGLRYRLGVELRGSIVYRVLPSVTGVKRGDRVVLASRNGAAIALDALMLPDAQPVTLTLERAGVTVYATLTPTLDAQEALWKPEASVLERGAAYLRVPSFRPLDTAQRVHSFVSSVQSRNPSGLLLDLRFNTGGYLDESLLSLGAFLEDGAVLGLQYRTASITYSLRAGGLEAVQGAELKRVALDFAVKFKGRVAILVNAATSSAAEVFALAAQRSGIQVIGESTAGRARYAALPIKLKDGSELRLSVARNTYPNGDTLPSALKPNVIVKDDLNALTRGADPVLEAGLKALAP